MSESLAIILIKRIWINLVLFESTVGLSRGRLLFLLLLAVNLVEDHKASDEHEGEDHRWSDALELVARHVLLVYRQELEEEERRVAEVFDFVWNVRYGLVSGKHLSIKRPYSQFGKPAKSSPLSTSMPPIDRRNHFEGIRISKSVAIGNALAYFTKCLRCG